MSGDGRAEAPAYRETTIVVGWGCFGLGWRSVAGGASRLLRRNLAPLCLAIVLIISSLALPARGIEIPPTDSPFHFQTNGPNVPLGTGDWYTSTAPGAGSGYHYFRLTIPCVWPSNVAVHIDLLSPEMNEKADITGADEEPNGDLDSTEFELYGPGASVGPEDATPAPGAGTLRTVYQPSKNAEDWVRFATIDPAVCGPRVLRSAVLANDPSNPKGTGDDQNGWRLRFGRDDDTNPNNTPPANTSDLDGIPGSGDELLVGMVATTYQHSAAGTPCETFYEYVKPGSASLTFHNFDMDGKERVRYYAPSAVYDPLALAGGVAGSISTVQGTWNGSDAVSRSGDTITNPETGWWRLVSCINSNNQYIFEGQRGVPIYFDQPPTPVLSITKTDGATSVVRGTQTTYTMVVRNTAAGPTRGAAHDVVVTDTLPAGLSFVSCAIAAPATGTCGAVGQVVTAPLSGVLPAGAQATVNVTATVADAAPDTVTNPAVVTYADVVDNPYRSSTSDVNAVVSSADLGITKINAGRFPAGGTGQYTLTVTNNGPSAAPDVTVTDTLPAGLTYLSASGTGWICNAAGQTVTCSRREALARAAPTAIALTVAVSTSAAPSLTNTATVASPASDPVAGNNLASHVTVIDTARIGDRAFVDGNGNGAQDAGEPGLSGVVVVLREGGSQVASTTTDGSGNYSFPGLAAGTYTVDPGGPAGFSVTTGNDPATVTVAAGEVRSDVDFGFRQTDASVGDRVFNDLDGNGAQDAGEPGLSGVVVVLREGGSQVASTTTDGSGNYSFPGLAAGTYTVDPGGPAGFSVTTGNDPATVTVAAGEVRSDVDFGFRQTDASVGDRVFNDLDGNGAQDAGEPGLSGVVVVLREGGSQVASTTTDGSGNYSFPGLAAGTYTVDPGGPAGFSVTTGNDPATVTVAAGEVRSDVDFGFRQTDASVGDRVFNDLDGNGAQDAGEPGLSGVVVVLREGGSQVASTTTDGSGNYSFPGLAAGTYTVDPGGPAGFSVTTGNDPATVTVAAGEVRSDVDFGFRQTDASVGDRVFNDLDGNGAQDAGEPGLSGVDVVLRQGGTAVATTTTDGDGNYTFAGLAAGTYTVDPAGPGGFSATTGNDPATVTISAGEARTDVDFGYRQTNGSIGDRIFDDVNGNGTEDPGEAGIAGVTVVLRQGPTEVSTTATDGDGNYSFTGLAAGAYTVDPAGPAGYTLTAGNDPETVTLTPGETRTDVDFGYRIDNRPPAADDDTAATEEDTAVVVDVLANDTDPDLADRGIDPATVAVTAAPANGAAAPNPDGTVTYIPAAHFNGTDTFTYRVCDRGGLCDSATVTVTVAEVNDAPVAVDDAASTGEDTAVTLDPRSNDSDADADALTVSAVSDPANGSAVIEADGTVTYTPDANFSGTDTFTYTVSDGRGGTDTATVTVTVAEVNDPPVAVDDAASTGEDTAVTLDPRSNDSDADADALTVSAVSDPANGSAVIEADGTVTYTPDANFSGTDTFTYTVSDGRGGTDTATVTVTVAEVNDPPVAVDDAASTGEDTAVTLDPRSNDSDADADALTVSAVSDPANGSAVIEADGTVTYTPDANFSGTDTFTYTVSDGRGGTDTATVTVTVAEVNDPPVATDETATTNEDTSATVAVLSGDTDPDGDTLTVTGVSDPPNGAVVLNGNGTVTYTPSANFSGTDTFTYTISDGRGGEDTATVIVTVTAVADPPTAVADPANTDEDTSVTIAVAVNDSDPDGDLDPTSVVVTSGPAQGSAVANGDGTVTYTPDPDTRGTDSFVYRICDGGGRCDEATVTVNVAPVADPPVAVDDSATTDEDTAITLSPRANDSDPDGDPLTVTAVSDPANGTAVLNGDGTVTYTPDANFAGTDTFTYTVSDGQGGESTATVTMTVVEVNDPPVATDEAVTTAEDSAVVVAVLAGDSDPDGDPLSVTAVSDPANGSAVIEADGTVTYTPDANFSGTDTFTYSISDGRGGTATAAVAVTVTEVNDPPVATDEARETDEDTPATVTVLDGDSDPDGDPLTVTAVSAPANGTAAINPDGTVTYTPAPDFAGADSFTYTISDGRGGEATATVTITVRPVADPPTATDDTATTDEDTAVTVAVAANDTDPDGDLDPGTVQVTTGPGRGSAAVNPDGSITYTPDAHSNGVDSFVYRVCDSGGRCDEATVTVTVNPLPDPPAAAGDATVTAEDTAVTLDPRQNDSDPDGDPLTVTAVSDPANGTAAVNGDGTVTYTPDPDFAGTDTFTYTVDDGNGGQATATVTVTVTEVNDPPVAADDTTATDEEVPVTVAVLGNDTDPDDGLDPDSVAVTAGPNNGTTAVNPDGSVTYTPADDFAGTDSFRYRVCDVAGACDEATVTVTVANQPDPPVAGDDAATTPEDTAVRVTVGANDSDPDDDLDPATVAIVTAPANGAATVNGDGTITYTPNPDFAGTDTFTYRVCDRAGACDQATVTVTVDPVADPPAAAGDTAGTAEDTAVTLDPRVNDSDPDGDPLTVASVSDPANGTAALNGDGTVTYTPDANFSGVDTFTYQVCDGTGRCASATVTVTVTEVNDPPLAADDAAGTAEDSAVTLDPRANDSDPDGDPLTVTALSDPANGTAVLNGDGTVTYTPDADFAGTDTFTYTVSDGRGGETTGTVTITVSEVNDPPTATGEARTTAEDTPVTVSVLDGDTDPDGDTLTVTAVSDPANGTAVIEADNTVTYTPDPNFAGTDTFTYTVADGRGATATATVTITVTEVNDPPVATDDLRGTAEDTPVTFDPSANDSDPDGDALSVTALSTPANGTATLNGDGTVTYTPGPNFAGTDTFTYTVSDGRGGTATATVTVTVGEVNDPPVAAADTVTTAEDNPVTVDPRSNDSDPDGDPLTVTAVSRPADGRAVVNGDGTVTYTPDPNFAGTDTFTYTVADGRGGTATATVTVTVDEVNDPPIAAADARTTPEDTPVVVTVLDGDSDADGDALTVTAVSDPARGTATLKPDNTVTYLPDLDFNGVDTFTYTIADGRGGTATTTVTVTVGPVNDPPAAEDDTASTPEDDPVVVAVLANDTDVEGGGLTVTAVSDPARGTAAVNGDGTVTYTPDPNLAGVDTFTYTVCDPAGACATATVTVTVTEVNDPPTAGDDAAGTAEDTPVTIAVLVNDADPDGDVLTVTGVSTPAHGTTVTNPDGTVTYTPDPDFAGPDSFAYAVDDGRGGTASATVTLTVSEVNDPPVAEADSAATTEDTAVRIDVLGNDTDPDDGLDAATVAVTGAAAHGTTSVDPSTGAVTYTPVTDYAGPDVFTYQVCDRSGACTSATVTLVVTEVNDAPAAAGDSASTAEDAAVTLDPTVNDSDPDGDPLTVTAVSDPANGTAALNGDGTVTYTPDPDFAGTDAFTYTVADGRGGTATATVTVTVTEVNDAPRAAADTVSTPEDTVVTLDPRGNDSDPDGDPLTVTGVGVAAHGVAVVNGDGTVTYRPADGYSGTDTFTYTVADGRGGTATATVTVTVDEVNDAPAAVADNATTPEDTPVTFDPRANDSDPDGDPLTVTSVSDPANGLAAINADGTVTYTPDPDYAGPDSFSYTVADGRGGTASATVTLTVTEVNDPPRANPESRTTPEDTTVTLSVLANDSDPDGDVVSVVAVSDPANGTAGANPDGTITYRPDLDFNGTDTFTYTVSDGRGGTASTTVTIFVGPVNDPPDAVDDAATTDEDTPVAVAVLANDRDPEDTPLRVGAVTPPGRGVAVANADGTVTYTPEADFSGTDTFTYEACDAEGICATATVTVTVIEVNDAPVANDDAAATLEDAPVTVDPAGNDSDPDGDPVAVIAVTGAAHGTVTLNPDGTVTYNPDPDYAGPDSFRYTVSDGRGGSGSATVTVTVSPVNDAPAAADDAATTAEDSPVTVAVLANDTDADRDPLTVTAVSGPAHGTATVNPDGTVTYTPDPDYAGPDTFTYTVSDGQGGSTTARVTVTVDPVNDAPVAAPDTLTTAEDTPAIIAVRLNDTDPDGDPLTVTAVSDPAHGTAEINEDGTVSYTPDPDYAGPDTFTYTVSDGRGGLAIATVTVAVTAVADPPLGPGVQEVVTDEDTPVAVPNVVTDPDGDDLTITSVSKPAHGTAVVGPDGQLVYTPDPDYHGADTFNYRTCDPGGSCAKVRVNVTVRPGADPPVAVPDTLKLPEDSSDTVEVVLNDSDPDDDVLTVVSVSDPAHGTVRLNPDGSITYTPNPGYHGPDAFSYTITDGTGGSATTTVTVAVIPINHPPAFTADPTNRRQEVPQDGTPVAMRATDPDGDPLVYTVIGGALPEGLVLRPDGTFAGFPAEAGLYTVVVQVVDHRGGIDEVTLVLDVPEVLGEVIVRPPPPGPGTRPDPDTTVPETGGEPGPLVRLGTLLVVSGLLLRLRRPRLS